jgi:hypothetical protein
MVTRTAWCQKPGLPGLDSDISSPGEENYRRSLLGIGNWSRSNLPLRYREPASILLSLCRSEKSGETSKLVEQQESENTRADGTALDFFAI